ncbi:MAG: Phytochrome-like protein cph2 [Deltaproteobacteria bacterium ADurb.Bin151]|jgi:diguanylate cyclase (GGDEF)-like protein|nr:GGDEF domain-containing protein [Smithella sp.]OQB55885.1 MAG: Phytochrome-like protein cph2 [Deltaproteobacteria bacterium ADurb.Bin151]HNZ10215.1 GGDEF domain-containing protein [Smithellaceae bacterium]HOG81031.1 GGDEF domain-containing protein [Smithellaceae bacterium]HQP23693.1 GGDEF domain-containing protein [Smithellaceae bacterium]
MTFIRHKVNSRVVQDLKKRSTIGIIFYIVLSIIVTCADGFYSRHLFASLVFFFSNLGICVFRLVHLVIARKMGEPYEIVNRGIFYVSVVITALVWGCMLAYVEILNNEHVTQLMMNVCICGLSAGGVVAFIPDRRLAILFNLAMLMPATTALLVNRLNPPLTIMICLFSVYLVLIAIRGNKEYWNALENEYLLEVKSEEMTRLSNTDALTGLSNRRHFNEALEREWKRSGRNQSLLSLIILDIDYFKKINDTYGHQVGDEYLKKIAETLVSVFKRDSDIVARYGGEEFAVLLVDSDVEQTIHLAEAAIHSIAAMTLDHLGEKVSTTISAGVNCRIPDHTAVPDSIILGADKALYAAKERGRNQVVFFG